MEAAVAVLPELPGLRLQAVAAPSAAAAGRPCPRTRARTPGPARRARRAIRSPRSGWRPRRRSGRRAAGCGSTARTPRPGPARPALRPAPGGRAAPSRRGAPSGGRGELARLAAAVAGVELEAPVVEALGEHHPPTEPLGVGSCKRDRLGHVGRGLRLAVPPPELSGRIRVEVDPSKRPVRPAHEYGLSTIHSGRSLRYRRAHGDDQDHRAAHRHPRPPLPRDPRAQGARGSPTPLHLHPRRRRARSGATLTDVDGNTFIDFTGGVGCLNVGTRTRGLSRRRRSSSSGSATRISRSCRTRPTSGSRSVSASWRRSRTQERRSSTPNRGGRERGQVRPLAHRPAGSDRLRGGFHGRTLLSLSLTSKTHPYKAGLGPFAPRSTACRSRTTTAGPTGDCARRARASARDAGRRRDRRRDRDRARPGRRRLRRRAA